ncbi:putative cytochrome C [Yersinia frederiksenii]|uniref:Cytochrome c family protein n=2 Tax=Yersinia frederiksenii TaxID=29484 RepID=A0ABR4W646_YERFR|nr:cytochrome c [Yersinia frederiksenii]EEQ15388.1 cytochrome C [Yersinia frederiksenii ATCC 33641]KGA47843.1 cytochrome c family protein [Yersinia frederiksenii ATCC 33641]SUP76573.1 putative cytochrome C [Yersinia frederiksenii]
MKKLTLGHSVKSLLLALGCAASGHASADANLIARGEYLTKAADCVACHTTKDGKPFAGGLAFKTPMGTLYSPNITPDKETGIGRWSDEEFLRALHEGKGKNGENLYPAFPYTSYTLLQDDDVKAIKAYLFSLPAVHQPNRENDMPFPFNQRWGLWFWNLVNFDGQRFEPDSSKDAQWNQGAYFVEALGHCGECHTPRNITMGMKDSKAYAGTEIDGWTAFNITSDPHAGIGGWSQEQMVQYLRSGHVDGKAQAAGPMAEVIENSTRHLTDSDLNAMAVYLRSLKPLNPDDETQSRSDWGQPATSVNTLRGMPFTADNNTDGARLYLGNCASCHGFTGGGVQDGYYPSLMKNSVVGASAPNNLINVILHGVSRKTNDGEVFMPGFANTLTDEQVVSLSHYLLQQFGQPALNIKADDVKTLRGE